MHLLGWKSDGLVELDRACAHIGDISDNRIIEDSDWRLGVTVEQSGDDFYLLKADGSRNTHIPCAHYYFDDQADPQLAVDLRNTRMQKAEPVEAGKPGKSRFQLINDFQDLDDRDGWEPYVGGGWAP